MEYPGHFTDREPVVLCIDDDAQVLAALRRLLRSEPVEVVTAGSAAEGLAVLSARPVELVLADERMPGTGGCEFLAEVGDKWPRIGRVILTGYPGLSVVTRGFRAGVDILFQKPWDDDLLKGTIRRLIFGDGPPQKPTGTAEPPERDLGSPESRNLVVLVDDDPGVLAALKRSLAREPYLVLATSSPAAALRWVEMLSVSAVVSDERMADMSGTELLARVFDRSPETARILLTAHGVSTVRRGWPARSAECMIAKPWDDAMLRRTLREFLPAAVPASDTGDCPIPTSGTIPAP